MHFSKHCYLEKCIERAPLAQGIMP